MSTINPERLAQGIAALRSGAYQQAQGALSRDGRYCCLGVLTEVAIANGLEMTVETKRQMLTDGLGGLVDCEVKAYDGECGYLPQAAAEWYGFPPRYPGGYANPALRDTYGWRSDATGWNDSLGASFAEIADAFERTYLTGEEE